MGQVGEESMSGSGHMEEPIRVRVRAEGGAADIEP